MILTVLLNVLGGSFLFDPSRLSGCLLRRVLLSIEWVSIIEEGLLRAKAGSVRLPALRFGIQVLA